jgi:hypothetical protein
MKIHWHKLAEIKELREYFEADFDGFRKQIEDQIQALQKIDSAELDKLALLRALEVTNGCIQWAYRRQDKESLPIEQTRECMRTVIGFIQDQKIILANGEIIEFSPPIQQLIKEGRELYQDAFKRNVVGKEKAYYAYSTAQLLVYGRERINNAIQLIKWEFEALLTTYYIEKGFKYIAPYLEGILPDNSVENDDALLQKS